MLKKENYPNAYKEIYVILNSLESKEKESIPLEFINLVENKMNSEYDFKLDSKDFENQKLLKETKAILAYIYINYWSEKDEKLEILKKLKKESLVKKARELKIEFGEFEEEKKQTKLKELTKEKAIENIEHVEKNENVKELVKYKENIFTKLIKGITDVFKNIFAR